MDVLHNLAEILVPIALLHGLNHHLRLRLTFYLLDDQVLILAILVAVVGAVDEQIRHCLVVRGQDIGGNVRNVLHLCVVALMHGALESQTDQAVREALIATAVLNEDLHLPLDLALDILETEDLLEAEIVTREDHRQGQLLQHLLLLLVLH